MAPLLSARAGETLEDIDRSRQLIAFVVIWTVISSTAVFLRCWGRATLLRHRLGVDDAFVILSALILDAMTGVVIALAKVGVGRHIQFIDKDSIPKLIHLVYYHGHLYVFLAWSLKNAVILFFIRLSVSRYFRAWCYGYIALNTILSCTFLGFGIFACQPVQYFWDRSIAGGKCLNLEALYVSNGVIGILMDVFALLIPIRPVFKLHLTSKKKIQLACMFACGFFACIASLVRLTYLFDFNNRMAKDPSWFMFSLSIWFMLEMNIALIVVCLPFLNTLFLKFVRPKITGTPHPDHYGAGFSPQGPHGTRGLKPSDGAGSNSKKDKKRWPHDVTITLGSTVVSTTAHEPRQSMHEHEQEMDNFGGAPYSGKEGEFVEVHSASTSTRELQPEAELGIEVPPPVHEPLSPRRG